MKKRVMAMALASAMVLSMTAPATAADEGQEIAGGKDVSLTLWLTPSWKGVFSGDEPDADYDSFFKEAAKRYNEMHPNVTINVEVIAGDSRDEKLNVAESTDTLPDIVYEGAFTMSSYYHKGSIVALDDIISEDDKADIADGIWEKLPGRGSNIYFPICTYAGDIDLQCRYV